MLWHGRSFAIKTVNLLIWSIFKNMLYCIPLIPFNSFTGYSAGTYFPFGPQFIFFNCVTFIALFAYLAFEQDVSASQTEGHYDDHKFSLGKQYKYYIEQWHKNQVTRGIQWLIATFSASMVVFFVPWISLNGFNNPFTANGTKMQGGPINSSG
jgi:hypothetical protein